MLAASITSAAHWHWQWLPCRLQACCSTPRPATVAATGSCGNPADTDIFADCLRPDTVSQCGAEWRRYRRVFHTLVARRCIGRDAAGRLARACDGGQQRDEPDFRYTDCHPAGNAAACS